jgi:hypothetical protein
MESNINKLFNVTSACIQTMLYIRLTLYPNVLFWTTLGTTDNLVWFTILWRLPLFQLTLAVKTVIKSVCKISWKQYRNKPRREEIRWEKGKLEDMGRVCEFASTGAFDKTEIDGYVDHVPCLAKICQVNKITSTSKRMCRRNSALLHILDRKFGDCRGVWHSESASIYWNCIPCCFLNIWRALVCVFLAPFWEPNLWFFRWKYIYTSERKRKSNSKHRYNNKDYFFSCLLSQKNVLEITSPLETGLFNSIELPWPRQIVNTMS